MKFGDYLTVLGLALLLISGGCSPNSGSSGSGSEAPPEREAQAAGAATADTAAGGGSVQPAAEADSVEVTSEAKTSSAGTSTKASGALAAEIDAAPVQSLPPRPARLGDPELTAGIPGEGPLTLEQIQAWLDRPENHAPLRVELPMGLAAGASQIQIPDDNPLTRAKIELGRQLYFDRRLSADGSISCADCHHPNEGYARQTPFGVGIRKQEGNRNSPASYNRILSTAQFWDGRAASLEQQAVGPIANPIEMGNTHEAAVSAVQGIDGYRIQFAKIFGGPVTIDRIGKALATFERAIVTGPSPYDYYERVRALETAFKDDLEDLETLKEDDPELYQEYLTTVKASEAHPISESGRRGRELFFSQRVGCTACHVGANLTDEKYHNLGVGMDREDPDLGRFVETQEDKDRGAFKTPTIRNVALTAPYMHDGSQKDLEEVVEWYNKGGHANPFLSKDVRKLELTDQEKQDLVEFMKACTGEFPQVEQGRLPE